MSKDNLVFLFGGIIVGIIAGVVIANYSAGPRTPSPSMAAPSGTMQQAPMQQQQSTGGGSQQQLPEGQPPNDEAAMKQEIDRQEAILQKDPKNQQAIVALGNLYFDIQKFDKASSYYERAIANDPQNVNLI